MIWNGDEELIIGEFDDESGKVVREWRVKPGEMIPIDALLAWKKAMDNKEHVAELPYDKPPFRGFYETSKAEEVLNKKESEK